MTMDPPMRDPQDTQPLPQNEFEAHQNRPPDEVTTTQFRENSTVEGAPRRNMPNPNLNDRSLQPFLDKWDVAALIINETVGTGIFTGPPLVLLYTQNKLEAMFLWILGLLYTYLCMIMYLGYAEVLPFIGGEMIYLDAIFRRPRMLSYVLYGIAFVFLMNGSSNCLQFGAQVFLADLRDPVDDQRLVRLFAVCILTLVCFIIAYSNSLFQNTNKGLAFLKVVGMFVLFGQGVVASTRVKEEDRTFGRLHMFGDATPRSLNHFLALSSVLFAYNGWENATFVRADIASSGLRGANSVLAQGFIIGGAVVGLGYLGINATFLVAIGNPDKSVLNSTFQYAPWLFGDSHAARRCWAIATAVSAVGNIASIMYAAAKVKQSMAASNILPWSRLWIKQNRQHSSPTPAGALLLHWIWGVIIISYTAVIPDLPQATSFPGYLQVYVQKVWAIFITAGYPFLERPRRGDEEHQLIPNWRNKICCGLRVYARWFIVIFLCTCNVAIIILPCIGPYKSAYGQKLYIEGYVYPVVTAGILALAGFYYLVCLQNTRLSLIRLVGLRSEIRPLCNHQRHIYFGYAYRVFITDPSKSKGKEKATIPSSAMLLPQPGTPNNVQVPAEIDPAALAKNPTIGNWLQGWARFIFGWQILSHLKEVDPYHGPGAVGCTCYTTEIPTQPPDQPTNPEGFQSHEVVEP